VCPDAAELVSMGQHNLILFTIVPWIVSTTKRYVHPQADTVRAAMERARRTRSGHNSGHSEEKPAELPNMSISDKPLNREELHGRGEWIRTTDLLVPNQAL
jgi:hypothetical protein